MQLLHIQRLLSQIVKVVSMLFQLFRSLNSRNMGFPVVVGDLGVAGVLAAGAVGACVVTLT